jgi:gamma-glutamyl hercynylcysteine S-oxide hydrolase
MCRHLAYLGPQASLESLLIGPPHSLYRQAWAPRRQRHGTVNADGFGIGWYAGADPVPARYRRGEPIWGDPSLPDIARLTSSGAVLAAVRSATPGTAAGPEAAAPFGCGPWLFSHNGAARGWRDWGEAAYRSWADPARGARDGNVTARPGTPSGVGLSGGTQSGVGLSGGTPPGEAPPAGAPAGGVSSAGGPRSLLSSLEALTDSALLWALTLQRLRAGLPLDAALAAAIGAVEAAGGTGRLNLLLTDGRSVAATAYGDTLWYRQTAPSAPARDGAASVTVASEPDDDEPGWTEVPDRHVLTATRSLVRVCPLSDLSAIGPLSAVQATDHVSTQATDHVSTQATDHVSTQATDHVSTQAMTSAPKGS